MKSIFTYPNDSSSHFIDPDYVGDDTVGFQKRIKELKDGTFLAHVGTAPTQSVDTIMESLSKYNQHSSLEESNGNNSVYKFWEAPILDGDLELIQSDISGATAVNATTSNLTFSGNHGFYDSQLMDLSNFNNSWSGVAGPLYVKKIDATTIQLATDSSLNNLVEFYDLENADITGATAANPAVFTDASHDLEDGTLVTASGFDGSFTNLNGNNYYVQNATSTTVNLSTDSAGNNLVGYVGSSSNNGIQRFILNTDGSIEMLAASALDQIPDGSVANFDPNDSTTHGVKGSGTGISTELDVEGNLFLDETGTDTYVIYTNSGLSTKLNWKTDLTANNFVKDTNIALTRVSDVYTLTYTLTGTAGDHTGEELSNHQATTSLALPAVSKTAVYYLGDRSGDDYRIYNEVGRTTHVDIGHNIINADTVVVTGGSTEYRLFVPKLFDSAGAVISNSSIIVDDTTLNNLTDFDTVLAAESFTPDRQTGIDNVPSGDVTLTRRTATFNSKPVLDITGGTFSNDLVTSGFTAFDTKLAKLFDGDTHNIQFAADSNSATFSTHLENLYNSDPANVIGRCFVVNNAFNNGSSSTTNTLYMVPLGYNDALTENQMFSIKVFSIADDGKPLRVVSQNDLSGIPESLLDNAGDERLLTFFQQPFNLSTTGGSLVTYDPTDWGEHHNFGGTADTAYTYFEIGKDDHALHSGDVVTIKIFTTAFNNEVFQVSNMMALITRKDSTTDYITFIVLDSSNNIIELEQGHNGYDGAFGANYSTSTHYAKIETNHLNAFTLGGTDIGSETVADDNYALMSTKLDAVLTAGKVWANTTGTHYTLATTFDITSQTLTDATTGDLEEVYTPPTTNIIPARDLTAATAGTLTIRTSGSTPHYRYRLANDRIIMPGNTAYLQQTGASTFVNNARITQGSYVVAGGDFRSDFAHWPANMVVTTNSSGYITGFSTDSEFPGQLPEGDSIMFGVEAVPNTYTAPAASLAAQEDVFDTADEFNDTGYNLGLKEWPSKGDSYYKGPSSISFTNDFYNSSTTSQNGTVFTRNGEFQKLFMEVSYPPLTETQFGPMHAFALAVQGTFNPFYFVVHGNDQKRFLPNANLGSSAVTTRLLEATSVAARTALLSGYSSNQTDAILAGEPIITGSQRSDGNITHAINGVDANIYGEAKVKFNIPLSVALAKGSIIFQDPFHVIVTLDNEAFEYDKGTDGLYRVRVTFRAAQFLGS